MAEAMWRKSTRRESWRRWAWVVWEWKRRRGSGQAGRGAMGEAGTGAHMAEVVLLGSGAKARGGHEVERDEDEGDTG
mgnify:CR=1 FL=1